MNRSIGRAVAVAALLASSLCACSTTPTGPSTITTTTTTSTGTGAIVTETYSGTLDTGGGNYYFLSVNPGAVTTTLTAVAPDPTVAMGLTVGSFDGLTCTPVVASETAKLNSVLVGLATASVTLCLRVYDVGSITETTSYTVTVNHY